MDPGRCEDALFVQYGSADRMGNQMTKVTGQQLFISNTGNLTITLTTCSRYNPMVNRDVQLEVTTEALGMLYPCNEVLLLCSTIASRIHLNCDSVLP